MFIYALSDDIVIRVFELWSVDANCWFEICVAGLRMLTYHGICKIWHFRCALVLLYNYYNSRAE
jgi:hypothetical protein